MRFISEITLHCTAFVEAPMLACCCSQQVPPLGNCAMQAFLGLTFVLSISVALVKNVKLAKFTQQESATCFHTISLAKFLVTLNWWFGLVVWNWNPSSF